MTCSEFARISADCFVYYRVRADKIPQAGKAVIALMRALHERTGIQGALSRRIAQAGDPIGEAAPTWMESYLGIQDRESFECHLEAAVQSSAIAHYLPEGARRTLEWFQPVVCEDFT